ncbi:hypothetical protein BegalDRAFT_1541 [Beggiatoa alba B18LD]|uniref:Zinc ribbon domain-containing protein n=1 Tax=Beggiatoa alba B18LD TaxID=395493 RepID=I3CFM9_9GAMM|nr:zinc ribbon domain-containing protein [Beggiatoa alba]EIJ42422.1 hypothetical protein BegalDRAFT_1541 [Beggiatoa alba B18LD]
MPTYDYHCASNGQTIEAKHGMNEELSTWGELCANTGLALGNTPADTPIVRLITGGQIVSSRALKNPDMPACASGGCGGGMCGLH